MPLGGKKDSSNPDWLQPAILLVAGAEILLGLFFIYSAATTWTSLPSNPIAIIYFTLVLLVLPLLAVWAFALAYQGVRLRLAAILAAVQPVLYLLRFLAFSAA